MTNELVPFVCIEWQEGRKVAHRTGRIFVRNGLVCDQAVQTEKTPERLPRDSIRFTVTMNRSIDAGQCFVGLSGR